MVHIAVSLICSSLIISNSPLQPKFVSEKHKERSKARYPNKKISKAESLLDWVHQKALPVVGEMTLKGSTLYDAARLPVVTVFANIDVNRNFKQYQYIANRVRKVATAAEYKGKMLFNIANRKDFEEPLVSHYSYIKEEAEQAEFLYGIKADNMYYRANDVAQPFSTEALENFVAAFAAGKLMGKEVSGDLTYVL